MAAFLATQATHLAFADNEQAFDAALLLERLEITERPNVVRLADGLLVINRPAAQALTDAYPALAAGLSDVAGAGAKRAAMVFDALIEPETGRYLTDLAAFWWRWRQLDSAP